MYVAASHDWRDGSSMPNADLYSVDTETGTWTPVRMGETQGAAFDGERVWIATLDGRVLVQDGGVFVDAGAPQPRSWWRGIEVLGYDYRVRAVGPDHVFAYGLHGYLAEYDAGNWRVHEPGIGDKHITAVWADERAMTAIGQAGTIVRKEIH